MGTSLFSEEEVGSGDETGRPLSAVHVTQKLVNPTGTERGQVHQLQYGFYVILNTLQKRSRASASRSKGVNTATKPSLTVLTPNAQAEHITAGRDGKSDWVTPVPAAQTVSDFSFYKFANKP